MNKAEKQWDKNNEKVSVLLLHYTAFPVLVIIKNLVIRSFLSWQKDFWFLISSCVWILGDYPRHCVFDANRIINYLSCLYLDSLQQTFLDQLRSIMNNARRTQEVTTQHIQIVSLMRSQCWETGKSGPPGDIFDTFEVASQMKELTFPLQSHCFQYFPKTLSIFAFHIVTLYGIGCWKDVNIL